MLLFSSQLIAEVHPEQRLLSAIEAIQDSQLSQAEDILKALTQERPKFKLANMLYADLLKSKTQPLTIPGSGLNDSEQRQHLLSEIKLRLQTSRKEQYANQVPAALSRLDDNYLHAFVVDLDQSRLFIFENVGEQPKLVADYFVSMGRGGPEKEKLIFQPTDWQINTEQVHTQSITLMYGMSFLAALVMVSGCMGHVVELTTGLR